MEEPDIHKACDMCFFSSSCTVVIVSCHVHVHVPSRVQKSVHTCALKIFNNRDVTDKKMTVLFGHGSFFYRVIFSELQVNNQERKQ